MNELRLQKARADLKRAEARGDKSEIKRCRKDLQQFWVALINEPEKRAEARAPMTFGQKVLMALGV